MEKWENYLINTNEKNFNVEHLDSVKKNKKNLVYNSVLKSLDILNEANASDDAKFYVSEVLKWMDVAKAGSKEDRKKWGTKGYNLYVHNYGSAEIYKENKNYNEIVYILIKTHGLVGQYIRGEVNFDQNKEIYSLIEKNLISKDELEEVLLLLNKCIIKAVSDKVYEKVKDEIKICVKK